MKEMVGASGFEPLTTRTPSVCATRLRYAPTGLRFLLSSIPTSLKQFLLLLKFNSITHCFLSKAQSELKFTAAMKLVNFLFVYYTSRKE